jgi:hypothetical protein
MGDSRMRQEELKNFSVFRRWIGQFFEGSVLIVDRLLGYGEPDAFCSWSPWTSTSRRGPDDAFEKQFEKQSKLFVYYFYRSRVRLFPGRGTGVQGGTGLEGGTGVWFRAARGCRGAHLIDRELKQLLKMKIALQVLKHPELKNGVRSSMYFNACGLVT